MSECKLNNECFHVKRLEKLCGFCRGPIDDACCGKYSEYEKVIEEQRKISKDVQRIMK